MFSMQILQIHYKPSMITVQHAFTNELQPTLHAKIPQVAYKLLYLIKLDAWSRDSMTFEKNVGPAARQMDSGVLIYCQMYQAAISCLMPSYSKKITVFA